MKKITRNSVPPQSRHLEVAVIGGGPAGYTAAIYLARAGFSPWVFEGSLPGGALMTTSMVENFPGWPEGISGSDLMFRIRDQAEKFGAQLIGEDVTEINLSASQKSISTVSGEYRARAVIIVTGTIWRRLGVDGEERLLGRGVSTCATCDGFFFKDDDVAVIGGGDSALEEALFLTRYVRTVNLIHRGQKLRGSEILAKRVRASPKIRLIPDTEVVQVGGAEKVEHVVLATRQRAEEWEMPVSGVFIAIGRHPQSALVAGQLELTEGGNVLVKPGTSATNIEGVFAAGDIVDNRYRQAITAAGAGCMAALDAQKWLEEDASLYQSLKV